jgi:drug/metabolite transporter (DMT)-like permease
MRHPWAIPVALTGAVLGAGAYVAVRDAVRTEHPMRIVLWFPLVSVPMSIPGVLIEGPVVPHGWDWAWLGLVALSAQFGQVFLTRGLSRVPAGRATLANPLTTAFGALLGWVAFQEPLGWSTLAGGAALVTAILLASSGRSTTVQDVPVAPVSPA